MSRESSSAPNSSHGPPPYHHTVNGAPPSAAMYYGYPPGYGHAPPIPPTASPGRDDGADRLKPPSYPSASPPRHSYPSQINHQPPPNTSEINPSNGGNESSPNRHSEAISSSYPPPQPSENYPPPSDGYPPHHHPSLYPPPPPSENYPPPPEGYPPQHHPNLYGDAWRGHPMYAHNPAYPRETAYWPPFHPPPPPYWTGRGETHLPPKERPHELEGRSGATSPSQIETNHRDEVQNMGCTCKKTRCLKLYCQCFGAQLYCGSNCRCLNCYNVVAHDKLRKEAIKSILLRNPVAFDSKFKKTVTSTLQSAVPIAPAPINPTSSADAAQSARALAHKLGCKCRKSACMKKYCECYAGNVKCSANCRCIGCKNTGGWQFPIVPNPIVSRSVRSTGEPWLAAQNLTFLKRGSPPEKKKLLFESGDIASMPSLASSEGTSPGGDVSSERLKRALTPQKQPDDDGGALLLAAVAMTEFGQSPNGKKTKLDGDTSLS